MQDYYAPIITAFEAGIAFTPGREWTGDYHLDFDCLLVSLVSCCCQLQQTAGRRCCWACNLPSCDDCCLTIEPFDPAAQDSASASAAPGAENAENGPRWSMLDGRLHGDAGDPAEPPSADATSALIARPPLQLASRPGTQCQGHASFESHAWILMVHALMTLMASTVDADGDVSSAAEFLHSRRTYQGLVDANLDGEPTPVVPIKQGRTGRAAQYQQEGAA
jgi:hypothetical protein